MMQNDKIEMILRIKTTTKHYNCPENLHIDPDRDICKQHVKSNNLTSSKNYCKTHKNYIKF